MPTLTTRRIDSEKPDPAKDRRVADSLGLYLKVAKNGTKTFTFRYTYVNKRYWLHLGTYPETSLAQARQARLDASKILESGRNPLHVQHGATKAKAEALDVSELIEDFYLKHLKLHFEKPDDARKTLIRDIGGEIGKYLVPDVTKKDITNCIGKVVQRGAKVAANRTLTLARRMFEYAVDQSLIVENPVVLTRKGAGGKEKSKTTNLSFDGIADTLRVLESDEYKLAWQTRAGCRLVMATAKRPGEVVTMEWDHVNLDKGEWWNPRLLTKEKRDDHLVFLSKYSVRLLREVHKFTGRAKHVFQSPRHEDRHMDRHSLSRAILRLHEDGVLKTKFTPHDFRRTFSSRMADMGQMPHVVEKILDHQMEGVMAVYNMASYYPERKAAMEVWGARLEELSKR